MLAGGTASTPSLQKYLLEAALYTRVGLNLDDLRRRPMQEALDYITIMSLTAHEEARRNSELQARGGRR